jgi:hypothetical protein
MLNVECSQDGGVKSEVSWPARNLARCLSPKGGSVEVYSALLGEAEFEVVSLRFELSTAPRIGLSPYPAIHSKTCGLAVNSQTAFKRLEL